MGRRSEQRIAMRVPILVRGKDSRGSPFVVNAQTQDITATGASLNGLKGIADVGSKIEIEFQGGKAWFRIQWIGKVGTPRAGQAGVKCLEPGNYIWGVPLPDWTADTFDTEAPSPLVPSSSPDLGPPHVPATERRRFPRVACRIEALISEVGTALSHNGKVSDISLGGCYVEMLSPLPAGTRIELDLKSALGSLHARGTVNTSHMGMGMSVAFTAISPEYFEKLRAIAPPALPVAEPEPTDPRLYVATPEVPSNGSSAGKKPSPPTPSTQAVLESVLRILLRKGIVSEEEMAQEFEKLLVAKS